MNSDKYNGIFERFREKAASVKSELTETVSTAFSSVSDISGVIPAAVTAMPSLLRIFMPALHMIASFLLTGTETTLGARPFGIAFFAACGPTMIWAFAGATLRVIVEGRDIFINLVTYSLLLVLRLLARALNAQDRPKARGSSEGELRIKMAISVIGALSLGAYTAIANGFSFASLGSLLLMCSLTPALTFLFCGALTPNGDALSQLYRDTGKGAVAVALVFSLHGAAPLTLDLSVIAAFIVTQFATVRHGWIKGAVLGLFFGLSMPVQLVPIFALTAVVSGLLYRVSYYLASAAAVMAALSWTVYAGGYQAALSYSAEIFVSGIITAALFAADILTVTKKTQVTSTVPDDALLSAERGRTEAIKDRIMSEADAFSGMSDMLFRLSDKLRCPSVYDIRQAAEEASASLCRRCRSRERCWAEHEGEMSDAMSKLAGTLYKTGTIGKGDVPEAFKLYCREPQKLIERISAAYADLLRTLIERDKTEVMAFDYSAISAVLRDVISQRDDDYEIDHVLSLRLASLLRENKLSARRVCVFGGRRRTVYISDIKLSGLHIGEDDLRRLACRACGGEFSPPEFELSGQLVNATLTRVRSYSVGFERAQSKKVDSAANGDVAVGFECRDDRYCALISDGMGSGREAAFTSGMCALFIEKMMAAGNSASVTLKMLNCLLRVRGSECSATVDLLDLDLITGKARFIKSGAAPSFVVRGSNVYKISSKTIPVGIIRTLDAEETSIELSEGDLVVLVSDGITQSEEECAWLYSTLALNSDRPVAEVADLVLREAARRCGRGDDATVCALRILPPPPVTC